MFYETSKVGKIIRTEKSVEVPRGKGAERIENYF